MERKEHILSSDDDQFEDANEKVINDIMGNTCKMSINKDDNDEDEESEEEDDEKNSDFHECEPSDLIDDESQKDSEKDQTEEERETARLMSVELKNQGNEEFRNGNFEKSAEIYTSALTKCPVLCQNERAILYGNRSLAKIKLGLKSTAIDDCTKSIEFNPNYVKVLLRCVCVCAFKKL